MKTFPFLRFVPKPLRLTRVFQRPAIIGLDPPRPLEKLPQRESTQVVGMWAGGHFMPFLVDKPRSSRRRDPCD